MAAYSGRPQRGVCSRAHEKRAGRRIQVIAWRRGLLAGLRHGDHAHRYSRAIPAWRRRSSGRSSARRPLPQVSQCHPCVAKGDFLSVFGTATMPTSTSGASSRGEDGLLSPFVHEMSLSHGRRAPDRVFVHEMSLSHGCRGPDRVLIHEMSLSHGHRGPDWAFVHEMGLYHGRRGPERVLGQIMAFFG